MWAGRGALLTHGPPCGGRHLLWMLQNHTWMEIWARLRVEPEVQGGQVHYRAGSHDQGEWLGLTTRPRGGRGRAAAAPVVVGPFLPRGGPVPQWPPAATVLRALLKGGAALPQPKWDKGLWMHRPSPTMLEESSLPGCKRSSALPVPRPVVFSVSEKPRCLRARPSIREPVFEKLGGTPL